MTYSLKNVVFENGAYWVLETHKGHEVYKSGITHSTRCAQIGYSGINGLNKAIVEINRRIENDIQKTH